MSNSLNVLVVGAGGREHALVKAIASSPLLQTLYALPGNEGMEQQCQLLSDDQSIVEHIIQRAIDLVVFGPEQPLVDGEAEACSKLCRVVGPSKAAAQLEGSKTFMKSLVRAAGVPSADYRQFNADQLEDAEQYIRDQGAPIVVKASGLAAGKGVVVAQTVEDALSAVRASLRDHAFGAAGEEIVIEECLEGPEISVFHLVKNGRATFLGAAQDHKRQLDGDLGPNTGGMGTFSPTPLWTSALQHQVEQEIVKPTLAALDDQDSPFDGFLFTGIMLTADGPKLLEFNVRMGDPETQSLLPLIQSDVLALLMNEDAGKSVDFNDSHAVTVVLAAPGYPVKPQTGLPMPPLPMDTETVRFTVAGARRTEGSDAWISTGGRVLGVTGLGTTHQQARQRAYDAIVAYGWQAAQFRTDIGKQEE